MGSFLERIGTNLPNLHLLADKNAVSDLDFIFPEATPFYLDPLFSRLTP